MFGTKLREARDRNGLTGYRLAKLSGVPGNHIAVLESGKRAATPAVIAKLAPHIGVSAEEMQSWADADALGPERLAELVAAHADLVPLFYVACDANPPGDLLVVTLPSGEKLLPVFSDKDAVYRSGLVPGFLRARGVHRREIADRFGEWKAAGFKHVVIDITEDRAERAIMAPLAQFIAATTGGRDESPSSVPQVDNRR